MSKRVSSIPVTRTEAEQTTPGMRWDRERLELLDQRLLPGEIRYFACATAGEIAEAIRGMAVRGAPAIGIAAAYGLALAARAHAGLAAEARRMAILHDRERLAASRPTAVNLVWALARFGPLIEGGANTAEFAALAETIHAEDLAANRRMAELGAGMIGPGARILTHCNTGPLATGGVGTAFGVIAAAWRAGRIARVVFTETRPWLQGARLTAWELAQAGVPATLMVDSAAAGLAARGEIDWLIVGADRIAANGDVANKIGTAALAALTRRGGGRVMVVAPFSTVDLALASGCELPIENRDGAEVWRATGAQTIPAGIRVENPVFDVTPAADVDLIITECGIFEPTRRRTPEATGFS